MQFLTTRRFFGGSTPFHLLCCSTLIALSAATEVSATDAAPFPSERLVPSEWLGNPVGVIRVYHGARLAFVVAIGDAAASSEIVSPTPGRRNPARRSFTFDRGDPWLNDDTFRKGDLVATDSGLKVFIGEEAREHSKSDFIPVDAGRRHLGLHRKAVMALDQKSYSNPPTAHTTALPSAETEYLRPTLVSRRTIGVPHTDEGADSIK